MLYKKTVFVGNFGYFVKMSLMSKSDVLYVREQALFSKGYYISYPATESEYKAYVKAENDRLRDIIRVQTVGVRCTGGIDTGGNCIIEKPIWHYNRRLRKYQKSKGQA